MSDTIRPGDEQWMKTVAALRAESPEIDRICGVAHQVFVGEDGDLHGNGRCVPDSRQVARAVVDLVSAPTCSACMSALHDEAGRVADLVDSFGRLRRGPVTAEDTVYGDRALFGGQLYALGSGSQPTFCLAGVLSAAEKFEGIAGDARWSVGCFDEATSGGLTSYLSELEARWRDWFVTEGAEAMCTLSRLAGPDAVAGDDHFWAVLPSGYTHDLPSGGLDDVFDVFAAAHLAGEEDPVGAASDLLCAGGGVGSEFVNASVEEIRALLAEGVKDLEDLTGRVREAAHRRSVNELLRLMESRVLPAPVGGGCQVVVADEAAWDAMFWSEALERCFPLRRTVEHVVVVVPDGLAECLVRSVVAMGDPDVVSHSFDEAGVDEAVWLALVALLDDGLDRLAALETAVALNC